MPEEVRTLRLYDMLARQKGSVTRRLVHAVISIALRLFFRRIETSGVSTVPMSGPVIFVLNHPNGLIDPALVFCGLPRRVSFLAKSTLFKLPVISFLMRTVDALPLYRRIDPGEDVSQNRKTFEACQRLLRQSRCIALFPEGISHNSTQLMPIKTGAARIALGAISISDDARDAAQNIETLKIVPVGLYYTSKTSFRSEALIRFGEHLEVHPVELDEDNEPPRDAVRQLSKRIETALREVTLNVESDEALEEVVYAEQLFSSIYESIHIRHSLAETFNLLRRLAEWRKVQRTQAPERIARLRERIIKYEEELRDIGITTENLSLASHSRWYVVRHFLLKTALLALLFPLAIVGAVLHFPAYQLCDLISRRYQKHGADDIVSTAKILAAIMLMPLTWIVVTGAVYFWWGWRVALLAFPVTIVCGYVAMRFLEEVYDMRGWYKSVLVLLRRRGLFLRLLLERRSLHNEIEQLTGKP
jgi:glycerol-3-phosphate O-acyltransferase/dihydroxyacetone phosphate acyltransferase